MNNVLRFPTIRPPRKHGRSAGINVVTRKYLALSFENTNAKHSIRYVHFIMAFKFTPLTGFSYPKATEADIHGLDGLDVRMALAFSGYTFTGLLRHGRIIRGDCVEDNEVAWMVRSRSVAGLLLIRRKLSTRKETWTKLIYGNSW